MEKKKYTVLDMETVFFEREDVIVTSYKGLADANEALGEDATQDKGDVMY
ncbi:MAG: hypothetical protein J5752_02170 [Clostridiales bacterium]|nr:hypothetical protein [Clostridiales bacterium]